MIWSVAEVITSFSSFFELYPRDLIFTGTPAGIGPLVCGDLLIGEVENLATLNITIV